MAPGPIPEDRLKLIVNKVCTNVFQGATAYDHSLACGKWNADILNQVLQEISDELTTIEAEESTEKPKLRYKYLIHSALIQHTAPLNQLDPDTKEPIRPDPPAASVSADGRASTPEPPVGTAAADNHKVTLKQESKGRRGLHIATCARWNSETDGVFNTKFEPGEDRDWDVIVSISWLSY